MTRKGGELTKEPGFMKKYGFYLALLILAAIVMLPTPEGLSVAGQRMIGIMVFSVIVWATTAVSYPVSAGVIMVLIALLIGFAPNPNRLCAEPGNRQAVRDERRACYGAEGIFRNGVLPCGGGDVSGSGHDQNRA